MELTSRRVAGRVVITITGPADLSTVPQLYDDVHQTIADTAGEIVVVELDGLTGLDDAALGVLLGAAARAHRLGGDIEFVCTNDRIRRRLAATRFDEVVELRSSMRPVQETDNVASPVSSISADRPKTYTAVIFSNQRSGADPDGYDDEAGRMEQLASEQPGYLGIESVRGDDDVGITVSYWTTEADARAWKQQSAHLLAQRAGRERWYSWYRVRVATVEREYSYDQRHGLYRDDPDPA